MDVPRRATPRRRLDRLEALLDVHSRDASAEKIRLLAELEHDHFATARDVRRLHDALLVLRACPDEQAELEVADRQLASFAARRDLRRFAKELTSSGIAGAPIDFSFYWATAEWLSERWPDRLVIDWPAFDGADALEDLMHLLVPASEIQNSVSMSLECWMRRLAGPDITDGAFLVRRFAKTAMDAFARERTWDTLGVPLRLRGAAAAPSRTTARWPTQAIAYRRPTDRTRRPSAIRGLDLQGGERLIDLLREAMVTRGRDLEAIAYANPYDAMIADCGDGLAFAGVSMIPERRFVLETLYVYLILENGVPIGYFQATALFGSAELNFNIFPPHRGRGAAEIYARGVDVVRKMLGVDALAVDPYQLGDGNKEALESGAFWFYYKFGYRPEDAERLAIVEEELSQKRRDPRHRSSRATLARLAEDYVHLYFAGRREDVLGKVDTANIGLKVSDYVAKRFGADRERATRTLAREAQLALGVRDFGSRSVDERRAWERWAPIVAVLPELASWTRAEKRALAEVIFAKGGRYEHVYAKRFAECPRLERALLELARGAT